MRPSKKSDVTDSILRKNTKSVQRRSLCDFDIKTHPRIQKNSNIYKMLKFGPLPDGDFSYLLKDGKPTKYARWLLISTDLNLSFFELCILVRIMTVYVTLRDKGVVVKYVLREYLFGQFCFDFDYGTVRNALTKLKSRDYIIITPFRSVSCTDDKVKIIENIMGDDFGILHDYVEEIMSEDLLSPAC